MHSRTQSSASPESGLTLTNIKAAAELMKSLREDEPFYKKMKELGNSPDDGWVMFIPKSLVEEGALLPPYVKISQHIKSPVMMNQEALFPNYSLGFTV